jgi:hypothetical protein
MMIENFLVLRRMREMTMIIGIVRAAPVDGADFCRRLSKRIGVPLQELSLLPETIERRDEQWVSMPAPVSPKAALPSLRPMNARTLTLDAVRTFQELLHVDVELAMQTASEVENRLAHIADDEDGLDDVDGVDSDEDDVDERERAAL